MSSSSKLKKSFLIRLLIGLCAMLVALTALGGIARHTETKVPDSLLFRFSKSSLLSFYQLESAQLNGSAMIWGAAAEETGAITVNGKTVPVIICYVNPAMLDFYDLSLSAGTFFEEDHMSDYPNSLVISQDLAAKLFLSNGIGTPVDLGKDRFQVVGVYRSGGLLHELADRAVETVYAPYSAGGKTRAVQSLMVQNTGDDSDFQTKNKLVQRLSGTFLPDETINLRERKLPIVQNQRILHLVCFGLFAVVAIRMILMLLKKTILFCKTKTRDHYFWGVLRKGWYGILPRLPGVLLLLFLLAKGFQGAVFEPFFLPEFLPTTNLFDFSFYWQVILQTIQQGNTAFQGYHPIVRQLSVLFHTQLVFMAVFALGLWGVMGNMRKLFLLDELSWKTGAWMAAAALLGVLGGELLLESFQMDGYLPLRSAAYVAAYLVGKCYVLLSDAHRHHAP